ncbi:beta-lactamase [[Pantoea] beijingensis]|uniref:Beta-lactamase n=1 Tax=[Pantoea] beijingensis TaxID=1324864 RepID=A0A443IHH7_9GAMM|nr:MBL fold metallo-hydrolase [[Pantoea] beijingensis]RWR03604.1 beta-lactamase [[Pantoea] beijingensis]
MITLCKTCGTSYARNVAPSERCKICEDERQYVPPSGQQWLPFAALAAHQNKWKVLEKNVLSLQTVPAFAIGQRAFLLRTSEGNILWDCIANLDDATKTLIDALGGLSAIAISHPHYYSTMQDWGEYFNAPVWLHADDSEWIMRESPLLKLWQGETHQLTRHVQIIRLGGHFAGGTVLHWDHDNGVLLTGDILQVTPGADAVSFMWSYPNMLPLPAATVAHMTSITGQLPFERLYGAFEGQDIKQRAREIVQASGKKYIACLR